MGNFFKKLFGAVVGFGKQLAAFLIPVVKSEAAHVIEVGLPIALKIVESYEYSGTDGTIKRDAAVAELRSALRKELGAAAVNVPTQLLVWITETALLRLRTKDPAA